MSLEATPLNKNNMVAMRTSKMGVTRSPLNTGSLNFVWKQNFEKYATFTKIIMLDVKQHGSHTKSTFTFWVTQ